MPIRSVYDNCINLVFVNNTCVFVESMEINGFRTRLTVTLLVVVMVLWRKIHFKIIDLFGP